MLWIPSPPTARQVRARSHAAKRGWATRKRRAANRENGRIAQLFGPGLNDIWRKVQEDQLSAWHDEWPGHMANGIR